MSLVLADEQSYIKSTGAFTFFGPDGRELMIVRDGGLHFPKAAGVTVNQVPLRIRNLDGSEQRGVTLSFEIIFKEEER